MQMGIFLLPPHLGLLPINARLETVPIGRSQRLVRSIETTLEDQRAKNTVHVIVEYPRYTYGCRRSLPTVVKNCRCAARSTRTFSSRRRLGSDSGGIVVGSGRAQRRLGSNRSRGYHFSARDDRDGGGIVVGGGRARRRLGSNRGGGSERIAFTTARIERVASTTTTRIEQTRVPPRRASPSRVVRRKRSWHVRIARGDPERATRDERQPIIILPERV